MSRDSLLSLWFRIRWPLVKILAPMFVLGLGCMLLWIPAYHSMQSVKMEREALSSAALARPQLESRIDSLQALLQDLSSFETRLKALSPGDKNLDSLRKSAERAGIKINDMVENVSSGNGFASRDRMDLEGDYSSLLAWVGGLDSLNPRLQILSMHLSSPPLPNGDFRLAGLEIGHLAASGKVDTGNVDGALWLARAKRWMQKQAWVDSNSMLGNPLLGHQPKVIARAPQAPTAKPVSPAPKLRLVGLVAGRLATVEMEPGGRRMLRPGDQLGEWTVASITAMSLILENAGRTQSYSMK